MAAPNCYGAGAAGKSERSVKRGKEMDIPMDVEVFCTDGKCGRSTGVVLRPKTEEVTHLIVKEKDAPHEEIMVPVEAIGAATPDSINLSFTRAKADEQQRFMEVKYVEVDIPRYAGGAYSLAPYPYAEPEVMSVRRKAVPEGELALRRGARVKATNGQVGQVDEFLVDPESERVTYLVLQEGHLWGKKDVNIPVSEIERIEDNTVYLKMDKQAIGALPAVPVR
jgi:sporulation protein YlmC with PRC-barrel domain